MSIWMMCEATTPGAVRDEYWSKTSGHEICRVESHKGLVLSTGEYNGYDDSDFYAVVWNEEKGNTERVTYASTRGWTYPNGATLDATDEVKAKYAARCEAITAELRAARDAREAAAPARGRKARTVRSVRGKSAIEAGVEGTIFWVGTDRYNGKGRVGFEATDGRKVFIAANAVEVVAAD